MKLKPHIGAVILIVLGVLFLLSNLGYAHFGALISTWWPLILIVVGVAMIMERRHSK